MKRPRHVNATPPSGVLYGIHAVGAWLQAAGARVRMLRHAPVPSPRATALIAAARARAVPVEPATAEVLRALAGTPRHQGVVAEVTPFPYAPLGRLLAAGARTVVVVDQLQDPHNLGAILRTTEAAGAGGLVLPARGAVPVTAAVEASAAGAAARVPVVRVANVVRAVGALKEAGYWAVGLAARGGVDLYRTDLPGRVAVVVGGERGVRRLVAGACDWLVSIPMAGQADSLNASVAAAVVLYELYRRSRLDSRAGEV